MESVAFRKLMYLENAIEFRDHMRSREVIKMIESAGIDPHTLDPDALIAVSRLEGILPIAGETLLIINPNQSCMDHMDFDRAICQAGIKQFVRRRLLSDRPGQGTAINPRTGKPDPTISVPDVDFGTHVVVRELANGIRTRYSIGLVISDSPEVTFPASGPFGVST